jgi:hypothetical protein
MAGGEEEYILRDHLMVIQGILYESIETTLRNMSNADWIGKEVFTVQVLTKRLSKSIAAIMTHLNLTEKILCTFRLRHVAKLLLLNKPPIGESWGDRQLSSLQAIHSGKFNILYGDPMTGAYRQRTFLDRRIGWTSLLKCIIETIQKRFPKQEIRLVTLSRHTMPLPKTHIARPQTLEQLLQFLLCHKRASIPLVLFDWPLSEYFPPAVFSQDFHTERAKLDSLEMVLVY